jgi:hypothetical protein
LKTIERQQVALADFAKLVEQMNEKTNKIMIDKHEKMVEIARQERLVLDAKDLAAAYKA